MKYSHGDRGLFFAFALLALAALIAPIHLPAQPGAGSISGSARDPTGAVVPGATVIVTNAKTNVAITVASNEAGDFTAPNLPVGQYSVRVEREKASNLLS